MQCCLIPTSRKDPLVNLNYAIFLYKQGDRKGASKQFAVYEQRMKQSGQEPDSDVSVLYLYLLYAVWSSSV